MVWVGFVKKGGSGGGGVVVVGGFTIRRCFLARVNFVFSTGCIHFICK